MRIQRHCAAHPEDTGFCAFGSGQARQDVRQGRTVTVTPDPRIKAVVLMAPLGVLFSTEALHAVTVPVRLYAAEKDEVLLASYNAAHIRDSLGRPPEYVVVPNGGHFSFVTPFPASLHAEVGVVDQDPPEFNRPAFQAKLSAEIVDFFDRTLKAGG
jgi:predicted dienelactone hydrolase